MLMIVRLSPRLRMRMIVRVRFVALALLSSSAIVTCGKSVCMYMLDCWLRMP